VSAAKSKSFRLIIMEEQFGPSKMTGTEAIQAIQANVKANSTTSVVIVSWIATLIEFSPGVDFMWPKDANATIMQEAIDRALGAMGH